MPVVVFYSLLNYQNQATDSITEVLLPSSSTNSTTHTIINNGIQQPRIPLVNGKKGIPKLRTQMTEKEETVLIMKQTGLDEDTLEVC